MLRRYQPDRRVFLATAKTHNASVKVVTDTRVIPVVNGTTVVMQPMILLHYAFSFEEEGEKQTWIFEEFIPDEGGKVSLVGSLLGDLYQDETLRDQVNMLDRTMALPPRP